MTREEYIEDIKISLGAPVVDIEIESIIGKLVDKAFREVSRYIVETNFVTVPYNPRGIDVKKYKIDSVIQIFRTNNPARVGDFNDIFALSTLNQPTSYPGVTDLLTSNYVYRTQMTQLKSTISTDLDFTFDKEEDKLYVSTFYPAPDQITIAYRKRYEDVSEVREMFWIEYIQRLSLAFCKESLGQVRGKYELSSSLYKLNGSEMVRQGIEERDAVRAELKENSDVVFPID